MEGSRDFSLRSFELLCPTPEFHGNLKAVSLLRASASLSVLSRRPLELDAIHCKSVVFLGAKQQATRYADEIIGGSLMAHVLN
jgi:hypothetical protein